MTARQPAPRAAEAGSPFVGRVRHLLWRGPVTCSLSASAADIARRLSVERVDSIIVTDDGGAPAGIVTDRDLRLKVVAENRLAAATPARDIMTAPIRTIDAAASSFDALVTMTRLSIHHLGVLEDGRLAGVISSYDFLRFAGSHPVAVRHDIDVAPSLEELGVASSGLTALVRQLVETGAGAHDVARIVAALNDGVVARVLALTTERLEAEGQRPPVPYAWLLFGSEARGEQTLRTDQDNGLVHADPPPELRAATDAYYARFAEEAIDGLVRVGFPRCPNDSMASNPTWRQPLSVWIARFRAWMTDASATHVLDACIYFDLRPLVAGDPLGAALRSLIATEAPGRLRFLTLLARDVVSRRVPLTLLGNLRKGPLDLKAGGSLQLVGAARLLALQVGTVETNSVERLRAAAAVGTLPDTAATEAIDAYAVLMRLRLLHQLEQVEAGKPSDNRVLVEGLSRGDRLLLRDALTVVAGVQARIRERFATDFVS